MNTQIIFILLGIAASYYLYQYFIKQGYKNWLTYLGIGFTVNLLVGVVLFDYGKWVMMGASAILLTVSLMKIQNVSLNTSSKYIAASVAVGLLLDYMADIYVKEQITGVFSLI